MSNLDKYNQIFAEIFEVESNVLNSEFHSDSVENWDSVTQLTLVNEIEDQFELMLDTDDILNFKSYDEGKRILDKYDVKI